MGVRRCDEWSGGDAGPSGRALGAGGGTDLGFGEGVGAVGRDAPSAAEGLSLGSTGAGSEGTTASSPRGELQMGERVSDDDVDGFWSAPLERVHL